MVTDVTLSLLQQPTRLPPGTPSQHATVAIQQWKKVFDETVAQHSHCPRITPPAKNTVSSDTSERKYGVNRPQPLFLTEPQKTPAAQKIPQVLKQNTAQPLLQGGGQGIGASSTSAPFMGPLPRLLNVDSNKLISKEMRQSASSFSTAHAGDAKLSALNLFILIDQNQAKLWLRDNRGERSQTNQLLAKVSQDLRTRNIAVSLQVVNGVVEFSKDS
jgi:hypothetical protein